MPLNIKQIIGHQEIRQNLKKLVLSKRLAHATIFSGPAGIGKFLVALESSQLLLCENIPTLDSTNYEKISACQTCKSCRSILDYTCPDIQVIDCSLKEQAQIDNIRLVMRRLHNASFNKGAIRIAIFKDAEQLSTQVCNLLLKSVEEPRAGTYYFFTLQNLIRLPITLRSRCQQIHFKKLSNQDVNDIIEQIFQDKKLSKDENERLIELSEGSLDNIDSLLDSSNIWSQITGTINQISTGDSEAALSLAQLLASNKETLKIKLKLIRTFLIQELRKQILENTETTYKSQACYATVITNLISAERLIFERNLAAGPVLSYSLLALSPRSKLYQSVDLPNSCPLIDKISF